MMSAVLCGSASIRAEIRAPSTGTSQPAIILSRSERSSPFANAGLPSPPMFLKRAAKYSASFSSSEISAICAIAAASDAMRSPSSGALPTAKSATVPKNASTSPRATDSGLELPPVPCAKAISLVRFSITVPKPSHFADDGSIFMVDVSGKAATARTARAQARVRLGAEAASALRDAALAKGDALSAAQIAGIMAAKQTPSLIPLTHGIPLAKVDVRFSWDGDVLLIDAIAATTAPTGVEMEAMVAASVSALTIYDMAKSVDKGIVIGSVRLLEKSGGKSGVWRAR